MTNNNNTPNKSQQRTGIPQLEDGYTRIANEILEAIARTSLTDYESRCIHFLWRKTYGWQDSRGQAKKVDAITYSQWVEGTGIDRRSVIRTLHYLERRNIITKTVIKSKGRGALILWGFQKRYHSWGGYIPIKLVSPQPPIQSQLVSPQPPLTHEIVTVDERLVGVVTPEIVGVVTPTKEKKENIQKKGSPSPDLSTDIHKILDKILESFRFEFGRVPAEAPSMVIPREPTFRERAQIRDLAQELAAAGGCPLNYIREAFREAAGQEKKSKKSVSYVAAILREWLQFSRRRERNRSQ